MIKSKHNIVSQSPSIRSVFAINLLSADNADLLSEDEAKPVLLEEEKVER